MKKLLIITFLLISSITYSQQKQIAITIDDLPFVDSYRLPINEVEEATNSLLDKLSSNSISATGFVIGRQLVEQENSEIKRDIVKAWLNKGQSIGNHTYSHPSLNNVTLSGYINNFNKNEEVLKQLYPSGQKTGKYFRYPFLQMGSDTTRKNGFERFLKSVDYRIAPVTIDNSDYIFNDVYVEAYLKGDETTMQKAIESYLGYLREIIKCYEQITLEIVGHPIKHIFLCHANLINADHFDKVIAVFEEEGYTFISLEDALTDSIYQRTDTLTISGGWSHIDRWKKNDGIKITVSYPEIDEEITKLYNEGR